MKRLSTKKWLLPVGILALILLVIGIAVPVLAASSNSNANSSNTSYLDGPTLSRLAGVLGLTPADLSSQLQSGKTLAALAQEKNVAESALVEAIVAPYADQLASRVKYGYLTQDQSDNLLANAKSKAGTLLQQDLSGQIQNGAQVNSNADCNDHMTAAGYGTGSDYGFMGPGMMDNEDMMNGGGMMNGSGLLNSGGMMGSGNMMGGG